MAIYSLNIKSVSRGNGSSAVGAAAYRAGERLRDERTGIIHDHAFRQDVLLKEIIVPAQFASESLSWATDRGSLWNAAEAAETRQNARVAKEFMVALPWELSQEQQVALVRGFSRELSERYGFAVDAALHAPRDYPQSDPRNYHAHLLATTREVGIEGLGAKTSLEWSDSRRYQTGMKSVVHEVFHVRERWAAVTNAALEEARINTRIDHRTLAAQGIDREPTLFIPYKAYAMERLGYHSPLAERVRADHAARLQARERSVAHEGQDSGSLDTRRHAREDGLKLRSQEAGQDDGAAAAHSREGQDSGSLDDIRRRAREDWLKLRSQEAGRDDGAAAVQSREGQDAGSLDDIRRRAREDWLKLRSREARQDHGAAAAHSREGQDSGSLDDIRNRAREDWLKLRSREAGQDHSAAAAHSRDDEAAL